MPTGGNGYHLFVIRTDMCANSKFVIANVTTWTGDHLFKDRHCFVLFGASLVERRMTISAGVDQGRFPVRENMGEDKVAEIENGLPIARFTPRKVKNDIAM